MKDVDVPGVAYVAGFVTNGMHFRLSLHYFDIDRFGQKLFRKWVTFERLLHFEYEDWLNCRRVLRNAQELTKEHANSLVQELQAMAADHAFRADKEKEAFGVDAAKVDGPVAAREPRELATRSTQTAPKKPAGGKFAKKVTKKIAGERGDKRRR